MMMVKAIGRLIAVIAAFVLGGCYSVNGVSFDATSTNGTFCERYPLVCVSAGLVVIGGIVGGSVASRNRGYAGPGAAGAAPTSVPAAPSVMIYSDARLKEDVRTVGRLPNGLALYSFNYVGDPRHWVGVMAQDVLDDPRYRHLVSIDLNGFYRVDASGLAVEMFNVDAMSASGKEASDRAARQTRL